MLASSTISQGGKADLNYALHREIFVQRKFRCSVHYLKALMHEGLPECNGEETKASEEEADKEERNNE